MAELVLERYELALDARETGDAELAQRGRDGDHDVNERYLALEGDCLDLLALQQPVAGDLRFVASSFKVVTDLERVGDLATNLAGYAPAEDDPLAGELDLRSLAETAGELVADAVAAYEAGDVAAARAVAARDDELDDACAAASRQVVRELLAADLDGLDEHDVGGTGADDPGAGGADGRGPGQDGDGPAVLGEDPDGGDHALVAAASRALLTVRDVERVGDHAVNVCARTVYAVDGDEELLY